MPPAGASTGAPASNAACRVRRLLRLDRDDARPAGVPRRNAADQPAAADRHQQRVDVWRVLLQLQSDAALAEQGFGLIVGMDGKRPGLRDMRLARGERIGVAAARDHKLCAISPDPLGLGRRGDVRHEDRGGNAEPLRRIGHGRAVIAAGRGDDTGLRHLPQQQVGEGAARLERSGMLQHLELEPEGRGRQAEIGKIGVKERRAPDMRTDDRLGRRNPLPRNVPCRCHDAVLDSVSES
ncbi:hypothetical protein ACVMFA_006688 [Bradyrhizobium liaoningense]